MDRSDVITLISEQEKQDEFGIVHQEYLRNNVFCSVNSISASEFFSGGMNGLNPQYQFSINSFEYNGEKTIEYNGKKYVVYRTFERNNGIVELYVEQRKGAENEN